MIPELPVLPQLKRNFKLLRASTFFKNASSLMRHAAAVLKGGKMILYFVSNPDSPYYQSAAFGKIIDYMAKYPRVCNLREQNGRRSMIVKDITDVDSAVRILQEMVSLG